MSGVTNTGFVQKTESELLDDLNTGVLQNVDPGLDLAPDQPVGQLLTIFAEKLAELWELGAVAYNGFNPNAAEGELLVSLGAITGTIPDPATPSQVICNMGLNASTTVPAGSLANVSGQPTNTWTLIGPPDSDGNPIPGPIVSTGAGTYQGVFQSTITGPIAAPANQLTVITAPVAGWNSVTNPTDAALGSNGNDPTITGDSTAFRQKREAELAAPGACTWPAIQAAVDEVANVISCTVLENVTTTTDGNGLPPKSFCVVVWDGISPAASNNDIAQAIWNNKPAGIQSFGTLSGTAIDDLGISRTVNFDRVSVVSLYVDVTTTPNSLTSPQIAAVKAALAAWGTANLLPGSELVHLSLQAAGIIPGVTIDVPTCEVDTVFPPVNTGNLFATPFQIFYIQTGNTRVNGV